MTQVVRETYVLDAQTPDFVGLEKQVDAYARKLRQAAGATEKALSSPEAAKLTQRQLEELTAKLIAVREAAAQISADRNSILSGSRSIDLSKTIGALTSLRGALTNIAEEFVAAGKGSEAFLKNADRIANLASGRGLRLSAAANAGSPGALAANQLREQELAAVAQRSVERANASQQVAAALTNAGVNKAVKDVAELEQVFKRLTDATVRLRLSDAELEQEARKLIAAFRTEEASAASLTGQLRNQEEATKRLADFEARRVAEKRKQQQALVDEVKGLRDVGNAARDAADALQRNSRFNFLGGEAGKRALKELTDLFAAFNLTSSQQAAIADRLVSKYRSQEEAAKSLTKAINAENEARAKLNAQASGQISTAVSSGFATPQQGAGALEGVRKRIEEGELRDSVQIRQAIVSELNRQRSLEKAISAENRIQYASVLEQRKAEAQLTQEVGSYARSIGLAVRLKGDLRAVLSQVVSESQKYGLTWKNNRAEIEKLLISTAELRKQQQDFAPKELNDFGIAFGAGFAAQQVAAGITGVIKRFSEFEDELIKVRRTADATEETMKNLGQEILVVGQRVPVAAKDLAAAAGALGQTGALDFKNLDLARGSAELRDAAKALEVVGQVSLVSEVNIEGAATAYGQFSSVFSRDIKRIEADLKALGVQGVSTADGLRTLFGAINEVGNRTVATTEDLLNFTRQFAGVATSLGISAENIIALGGAFRDFQVSADVAGTAATRFFSRASQNAEEFGKVLGVSADTFRAQFSADALGTVIRVFEALGQQAKTNKLAVTDFLRSLKVETREQNAFTKLIENSTELRKRLTITSDTLANYNSVGAEAAKRNETFSAAIIRLSNSFQALIETTRPFISFLADVISKIAEFVKAIADASLTGFITTLGLIGAGIAFVVLQLIKTVAQFKLAATAITEMNAAMREQIGLLRQLNGLQPAPAATAPRGGGVGGRIAGVAATVGVVTAAASIGSDVIDSYTDSGEKAGKAFSDGVATGVKEGGGTEAVKEEGSNWTNIIIAVSGVVALLGGTFGKLKELAVKGLGLIRAALTGVLASFTSLIAAVKLFGSSVSVAAAAAGGGLLAVGAALAAAATAGALVGTAINRWIVRPVFRKDLIEAEATIKLMEESATRFAKSQADATKATAPLVAQINKLSEGMTRTASVSEQLVNTWALLARQVQEAQGATGNAEETFNQLVGTDNLEKAEALYDRFIKLSEEARNQVASNSGQIRQDFRKFVQEVDKLTGTSISQEVADNLYGSGVEGRKRAQDSLKLVKETLDKRIDAQRIAYAELLKDSVEFEAKVSSGELKADENLSKAKREAADKAFAELQKSLEAVRKLQDDFAEKIVQAALSPQELADAQKVPLEEARKRIEKLRSELAAEVQKGLVGLDATIQKLASENDPTAELVEKFAQERVEFFTRLNTLLEKSEVSLSPEMAAKLQDAARRFNEEANKAFAQAWANNARDSLKQQFDILKGAVDDYFAEIELETRQRRLNLAIREEEASEQIQGIEAQIEKLKEQKEAQDKLAESFRRIDEIRRSALGADALRADDFSRTTQSMVDNLRDATVEMQDAFEKLGKSSKDTFDEIRKAAVNTQKDVRQAAFDFGLEQGARNDARRQRDTDSERTLRQSSTARNLVQTINATLRRPGLTEAERGVRTGEAIAGAEREFARRGIDASAFLERVRSELSDIFKDQRPEAKTAAEAVQEVGAETNRLLKTIADVLGARDAAGQRGALDSANTGVVPSTTGARATAASRASTLTEDEIRRREREIRGIRDPLERARREEEVRNARVGREREAVEIALSRALRESGLDRRGTTPFTEEDVNTAREALRKVLDENPQIRNIISPKVREQIEKIDPESLETARQKLQGKLEGVESPVNRVAEVAANATQAQKDQNASLTKLTDAITEYFKTIDPNMKTKVDAATQSINAAKAAAGN